MLLKILYNYTNCFFIPQAVYAFNHTFVCMHKLDVQHVHVRYAKRHDKPQCIYIY